MQNIIEVEKRNRYGSELIYPVNEQAQNACTLLGYQKTLTQLNIEHLKMMGFTVKQVAIMNGKKIEGGEL